MKISNMLGSFWLFHGVSTCNLCSRPFESVRLTSFSFRFESVPHSQASFLLLKQPNSVKEFALYFAGIIKKKGFVYGGGGLMRMLWRVCLCVFVRMYV